MRILLIAHHRRWRASYRSGLLAEGLARRGHKITHLVLADSERLRFQTSTCEGVQTVESPDLTFGRLRSGWDPVCAFRRDRWLSRQSQRYDLIHLFETRPATIYPGLRHSRRLQAPLVIDWVDWWGRGGVISVNRPWWYRALFGGVETFFEEHYRPMADATTVISYALAKRAASLGVPPETILHLRSGVDLNHFRPRPKQEARKRLRLPPGEFLIGYGAQDTFFDLDPVFEGVRKLIDSGVNAKVVLAGHDPPRIRRAIARNGLESHSIFLGYLSWNDDYPWFPAACDAMVCPFPPTVYNLGRWPGKFGEYLAAGRPVVFNPNGDLADFAANDAPGIPCDYTPQAFAEAFAELARSEGKSNLLGEIARDRACRELDRDSTVARLETFYEQIINRSISPTA